MRSTWVKLDKLRQTPASECSPIGACCRISWMFEDSPFRNIQHSTGCFYYFTQAHLNNSLKLFTNKENGKLHIPLSEKLHWKKNPSPVIQQIQVYLKYRQGKMKGLFSGHALHMTAIWGYCVFWPNCVVYDRWQERKSRAAGLSTDMQIAFSWLLYSAWYLSSGLQYASLFTARKQLINSTKGRRKGSWCCCSAGWKQKPLKWPVSCSKIKSIHNSTKRDNIQDYPKPTQILVCAEI